MKRTNGDLTSILLMLIFSIPFIIGCEKRKKMVMEPLIVGVPPSNAFVGLVGLENDEIRHYNYGRNSPENQSFYIRSKDQGFSWDTVLVDNPWIGADEKSPVSGEYVRLATDGRRIVCIRSNGGIDGTWTKRIVYEGTVDEGEYIMLKPPVFIRGGERILVGAHSTKRIGCGVFYSNDDGMTWKRSRFIQAPSHQPGGIHASYRWNHGAVEPTLVELSDGKIWMIARTAQDRHYESFSIDGGETWSAMKPSRFYGTITMPTMKRIGNDRLLFIWNNTTPLPEKPGNNGIWEDVFTNRDVLHAAISEDDGETWIGFRELILNPNRNDPQYAESDQSLSLDMSVHQNQFIELANGNILVSLGQHRQHRKLLLFNPAWLYETGGQDDFSNGLANWSTHLYQKGIVGHCAYNRSEGARLVADPLAAGNKVLNIGRSDSDDLEIPNQGAVWNFPALQKGWFQTSVYIPDGSFGGQLCLSDRWFNPCDTTAYLFAIYKFDLSELTNNIWHQLHFEWDLKNKADSCLVKDENGNVLKTIPLNHSCKNGISYVHFISTAERSDKGFFIRPVRSGI